MMLIISFGLIAVGVGIFCYSVLNDASGETKKIAEDVGKSAVETLIKDIEAQGK